MNGAKTKGADRRIRELDLHLHYRHGLGESAPFFDALADGKAVASLCPKCNDRRFPPRILCPHDRTPTESRKLSGEGVLVRFTIGAASSLLVTDGSDTVFGEVAMDGADNRVLARIEAAADSLAAGQRVRLAEPHGEVGHPIQYLVFEPIET